MLRLFALILLAAPFVAAAADDKPTFVIGYMGVGRDPPALAHVLGFINPDGSGETYPDFGQPDQSSWVFGPAFSDGRRMLVTSFGEDDIGRVRGGKVTTRIWIHDRVARTTTRVFENEPPAQQIRSEVILPGEKRFVVSGVVDGEQRLFEMDLDGRNQVPVSQAGEGFHYGVSLSHDGKRLAFHVTQGKPAFHNPGEYSINVLDLATKKRTLVYGHPAHLCFGPTWSPDDERLAYLDCLHGGDPDHFRAAVSIGRTDGSEHRAVTPPQSHWFGTPFGSNTTEWSPDGKTVTYTRLLPDSDRGMTRGGAQLCLVNPASGAITELTTAEEGKWDYRASWCPDGKRLTFTRILKGGLRELWIMNADGSDQQRLTKGYREKGADFGRWLRAGG